MKNNKKSYSKNRIKNFFFEKGRDGKQRFKSNDEDLNIQENDRAKKDQHLENPEEQGDLS